MDYEKLNEKFKKSLYKNIAVFITGRNEKMVRCVWSIKIRAIDKGKYIEVIKIKAKFRENKTEQKILKFVENPFHFADTVSSYLLDSKWSSSISSRFHYSNLEKNTFNERI